MPVTRGSSPSTLRYMTGGLASIEGSAPFLNEFLERVLQKEGGYVDHPSDKGGATNFGITQKTLSNFRGKEVSKKDVKNLTPEEAREIYAQEYFFKPGFDRLPPHLQEQMFDIGVNSGPGTAVKLLQEVAKVPADKVLGPMTLKASLEVDPNELVERRIQFYKDIVKEKPDQEVFLEGWLNRAKSFKLKGE